MGIAVVDNMAEILKRSTRNKYIKRISFYIINFIVSFSGLYVSKYIVSLNWLTVFSVAWFFINLIGLLSLVLSPKSPALIMEDELQVIDKEIQHDPEIFIGGKLNGILGLEMASIMITQSYLIGISKSEVLIIKLINIVWIYTKKIQEFIRVVTYYI